MLMAITASLLPSSQRKDKFISFFIPDFVFIILLTASGLSSLWLIDELTILMCFIFAGQEVSKAAKKL